MSICRRASKLLRAEPNLLRVDGKVLIIGDIHGQFYDLLALLDKQKFGRSNKKFLFMGDYVDRGKYQAEVVSYLFALKVRYPTMVYLMRGNHETREMTESYDFRKQMLQHYDEECYQATMEMFD